MKKSSQKIIFFGTESFSAESLDRLINGGYDIAAVVTKPDSTKGRGKKLSQSPVKLLALQHNIKIWQPENVSDIASNIKNIPNRIGILVSYGKIIPKEILDLFEPFGIVNLHPSLLPNYRGSSPIESVILNGEEKTGISLIKLVDKMDAGPIYTQNTIELSGTENSSQLHDMLSKLGSELLVDSLPDIITGKLKPVDQDEDHATYCKKIEKHDGTIDWHTPAEQIERQIRAYSKWPKSHTKIGGVDVIISQAHYVPTNTGDDGELDTNYEHFLMINTRDGRICVDSIQPLGKKEMPIKAFLAGYKTRLI